MKRSNEPNPVIMTEEDYNLLKPLARQAPVVREEMSLQHELERAIIVKQDALPPHTVRLNSKVTVVNIETQRLLDFTIVLPEHADIDRNKISVISPLGTALIGFRKGEEITWEVPGGLKRFRILDVSAPAAVSRV